MAKADIYNTDDIVRIYKLTNNEVKNIIPMWDKEIDKSVVSTSWVGISEDQLVFHLGLLSKQHFHENIAIIPKDHFEICYPSEYIENPQIIEDFVSKVDLHHEYNFNIDSVIEKALSLFDEISSTSVSVSRECHIGQQFMAHDGIYKVRLAGDVEQLLQNAIKGQISNHFEIVDVIKLNG